MKAINNSKRERIRQVIGLLNLTQEQVADKLDVTQSSISHTLKGELTSGFISRFALAFNVSLNWLNTGEGDIFTSPTELPVKIEDTSGVQARLDKVLKANRLSQQKASEVSGIATSTINCAISGRRPIKMDFLTKFANAFNININWLITGEGDMEANTAAPQQTQQEGTEIPLVPTSAMAGGLTGFSLDGVTQADCEYITSPIKGIDFAVPVYGESMSPEYPNGSRVLVQKINHEAFIEWGKVYVLDTCNGIVLKQVRKSEKDGWLSCYSINDNSIYAPFDVALKDVYGMYRVLMCLSLK